MLEPRQYPLPPDIAYCLDSASECFDIDNTTYAVLSLYGQAGVLDGLGEDRRGVQPRESLEVLAEAYSDYADTLLEKIPAGSRNAYILAGLADLPRRIEAEAQCLAWWAHEDSTTGGAMEDFLPRPRTDLDGVPYKRVSRRLHAPKFIRRYVRTSPNIAHFKRVCARSVKRMALVSGEATPDPSCFEAINQEFRAQSDRKRAAWQEFQDKRHGKPTVRLERSAIKELNRRRKVIRRAAVLAAGILGASTVGAFARGEPVRLDGDTIALEVRNTSSLATMGHGGLGIRLLDRSGTHLANLCVYVEKTPALDQLTGLALCLQNGMEKDIVETANLMLVTPKGRGHPLIAERSKEVNQVGIMDRFAQARARRDVYFQTTKDIWVDALISRVIGPRSVWRSITDIADVIRTEAA